MQGQAPQATGHYPRIGLLIDNEWIYDRPASSQVRNPSDETVLGPVPGATGGDLERALASAQRGFRVWRNTAPEKRAEILLKTVAIMRSRKEEIAKIITLEQGKPIADSRGEVMRASTFLEWDAAEALRTYGYIAPPEPGMQKMALRQPVGPVAAFTPWNVPISAPGRKLAGSLAAGCSVILKAAEETPGAACAFAQCFIDAGLPPGVLTLVFGNPAQISSTLIASPVVRMVTLTGSVSVGKLLSRLAGEAMKPVLMELGGHAPVLVDQGVDPTQVAKLACASKMRMAGQICASPTRFIVHRGVYREFVDAFAAEAKALKVGDGFQPGVQMGPVVNDRRLAAVSKLVEQAKGAGAQVAAGGHRIGDRGYFYAPTILADVPLDALAMHEEPFGPLGLCVPVDSMEAGIALGNSLNVGLSAYAFTSSMAEAERLTRDLECGNLSINHFGSPGADMPFGGVKDSGIGREGGAESLHAYMVTKTVLQRTVIG